MTAFSKFLLVLGVLLASGIGLLLWDSTTKAQRQRESFVREGGIVELSGDDIAQIIKSSARSKSDLQPLADDPAKRKLLIEKLGEFLAVSNDAYANGFAKEPENARQLELIRREALATAYEEKLKKDAGKPNDQGPPLGWINDNEAEAYAAAHESDFLSFQKMIEDEQKAAGAPPRKMEPDEVSFLRTQWSKVMYGSEKALELGLDKERSTQLQIMFQQAQFLQQVYGRKVLVKRIEPTEKEIDEYIKTHPEYDTASKRTQAEDILKRVKAGEDFAKLADEVSGDPGTKGKGGLYENISLGMFQPSFENAALALQPGQIADQLVETPFGYHIIKLEGKNMDDKGQVKNYNVRHILIKTVEPSPFGQPVSMRDKAKGEVAKEKQVKLVEELKAKNQIVLPEDFTVNTEGLPDAPPMTPRGMPGELPEGGVHEVSPKQKTPTKPSKK